MWQIRCKEERRKRKELCRGNLNINPIQEVSHIWNEYDHPDSDDDKNAFFVEFDPSTPLFPGQER